jgi:hypothetical protein
MNTPLNDDTHQKARELARKITVAHDLDPEIQEELYGHIEDKLLAYKSGEERVSDEDAFILVREHFGDAKVIRGLMQQVHAGAAQVGLFRRIMALVTVTAALQSIVTLIRSVLVAALAVGGYFEGYRDDMVLTLAMVLAMFTALYWQLRRWKKLELAGEKPWYARWSIPRMGTWLGIAVLMTWLIPTVSLATGDASGGQSDLRNVATWVMVLLALMSFCLIWLWWTDAPARGLANNIALGWLWALFMFATSVYPAKTFIALGDYDIPVGSSTFAHAQWGDVSVTAFLAYGGHWESSSNIFTSLIASALFALVGSIVAACWHTYRHWQQSHKRSHGAGIGIA